MEFVVWLLMQARDYLWDGMSGENTAGMTPRSQGALDVIHVLNEIIKWAEETHYGEDGRILPVASIDRQAFYDVLGSAISGTIGTLEDWDQADRDILRRDMVTHAVALDSVASRVCAPYYVTRLHQIASLAPIEQEATGDGTGTGTTVPNDDR